MLAHAYIDAEDAPGAERATALLQQIFAVNDPKADHLLPVDDDGLLSGALEYANAHTQFHEDFAGFVRDSEFDNIYLVNPEDQIVYSVIKGLVLSFAVVVTALYYGYRVRGGPVEVGVATAQSMATNLILVTVLNMVMTFVFWGFDPNLPIA